MQITKTTNVLLGSTEVQKACAEYIEKNGVTGAGSLYETVKFQEHRGVVQATMEVTSQDNSCGNSNTGTLPASSQDCKNLSSVQPQTTLPPPLELDQQQEQEVVASPIGETLDTPKGVSKDTSESKIPDTTQSSGSIPPVSEVEEKEPFDKEKMKNTALFKL